MSPHAARRFAVLLMLLPHAALAQGERDVPAEAAVTTPDARRPLIRVRLRDGQELHGWLVARGEDGVVIEILPVGRLSIPHSAVASIDVEQAAEVVDGEVWREDRNRTRYLYAPSAFTLRSGETYFSQKELFFSSVAVGVTDHVTLLAGTVLPAWFVEEGVNFIGAVKIGVPVAEWLHVAAGAETFVVPSFGGGGFAFGAVTLGSPRAHLTVAMGPPFAFSDGERAVGDAIVVVSGNVRVSKALALVSENWIFPTTQVDGEVAMLNGFALRFLGDRATVDVGLVRIAGASVPVPWLDFTWNFGR